jgi:hypothetical protein
MGAFAAASLVLINVASEAPGWALAKLEWIVQHNTVQHEMRRSPPKEGLFRLNNII